MVWSITIPFADSSVGSSLTANSSSVATKFYRSGESSASSAGSTSFSFSSRAVSQLLPWQENRDDASSDGINMSTPVSITTLHVDYHKSCTPLYKKIEEKDWDAVDFFLEKHHWPSEFFPDWRYAEQIRTWVTHFDSGTCSSSINQHERHRTGWSILPLHLALHHRAPFSIIAALVEDYPESIRCTDDTNLFPIHLAVRHGCCNEVVDYLFRAFPDAILQKCKVQQDLTPLDCKILRHEMVRKRMRILYPRMTPQTRSVVMRVLEGEESKSTLDKVGRSRSKLTGAYSLGANTASTPPSNTTGTRRECSYELDCTLLFKQIEIKEWTAIDKFLDSGYWPGSFFADKLSPAEQACTWVTRFDPDLPNHVRWSMLPLHMALLQGDVPFSTIQKLVELYPTAVKSADDQGFFPLHLAMLHGRSNQVLDFLFRAYPEALDQKAGKDQLSPLDCAMVGKDAVRARILDAFVKKSQADATKAVASLVSEQISDLRVTIEEKKKEISKKGRDVSQVFQEVTEKIKQCEHVTRQLQKSGGTKPPRVQSGSSSRPRSSESTAAARVQGERSKRPTSSSSSVLRHTKSTLSSVLRRVPGSNKSIGTRSTASVSTDANSLLA